LSLYLVRKAATNVNTYLKIEVVTKMSQFKKKSILTKKRPLLSKITAVTRHACC